MANDKDQQPLDAFASEADLSRQKSDESDPLVETGASSRPAGVLHAITVRRGALVTLAFALGVTFAWGLLRTLDSAWTTVDPASPTRGGLLPNTAHPIAIELAPDAGTPAFTTREVVATASTVVATPTSNMGTVRPESPAPSTSRANAATLSAGKMAGTHTTLVVPRVAATPPVVIPSSPGLLDVAPPPAAPAREIPAAATAAVISRAAIERNGVLGTLRDYEQAYKALDVQATAAIWPSVDRRALARAFATIKSQGLAFEQCDVQVVDSVATARCRGTIQYVRRIGSPVPRSAHQQWLFRMRKLGDEWKIDEIVASEISGPAPSRSES